MSIRTVFEFLAGRRRAILEVAGRRGWLAVGLLFVLAAAFAREYDGADLLAEPATSPDRTTTRPATSPSPRPE